MHRSNFGEILRGKSAIARYIFAHGFKYTRTQHFR